MSAFRPEGWPTVTPRLFTPDVEGMVRFLQAVFDAEGETPAHGPAAMRIGDSIILVSEGDGDSGPWPAFLYVYVADADATYRRAVEHGATTLQRPLDTSYGDRRATVEDRWGDVWQIATRRGGQTLSASNGVP